MIDLHESEIVGNFFHDNNSYNLIGRKKRVLDGIEHRRFIIPNYTPDCRKFCDDINIINYKIINENMILIQNFNYHHHHHPCKQSVKE